MNTNFNHINFFQVPFYRKRYMETFVLPFEGIIKGNMISNLYEPYKNHIPRVPIASTEEEKLMLAIQSYNFALIELNLYLDIHPDDTNAIQLFNRYQNELKNLTNRFEETIGPLTLKGEGFNQVSWPWVNSWPWEVKNS